MNNNLKAIHEYLIERGVPEESLSAYDQSSVYLAMEIMEYAHRNQTRENGEEYANHPQRCLERYRDLVGIIPDDPFCIDESLMYKHNLPFNGVQEVCLLHDVVEDTEFTLQDVKEIYYECGFGKYFDIYIEQALDYVTHRKEMPYQEYIVICLKNPISALVKMCDLQDNLNMFGLTSLDDEKYERSQGYLKYLYQIEFAYKFLERANAYKKAFAESIDE